MVILHIGNIHKDKSVGPNINVAQNIIYGNKYENVGLYNLRDSELALDVPKDKVFKISDYPQISDLPKPFNKPDIVIFQGVYFIKYVQIAKYLRKKKIPYIIVPRCSLTDAAIKSKGIKKKVANILFFNSFIKNANSIQFLTENEYKESKKNFKFRDFFIIGNGIEMPDKQYEVKKRNEFKIVFIGRYNVYHKGLDILLKSVHNNVDWFKENNVKVYLYGRDSQGGEKVLIDTIKEYMIDDIVILNGPVYDKEKEEVLLDSDVFIHTSRLEGHPTAVIEAISYGIPVIVTPGTNVADVIKSKRMGYSCILNENSIFEAIKQSFEKRKEYNQISKNSIDYAKDNFNWDSIIKESLDDYRKNLKG